MTKSGCPCRVGAPWQLPGQSSRQSWEGVRESHVTWFSTSTVKSFYINKNCEYIQTNFKYSPFLFFKTKGFVCWRWDGANTG